MFAKKCFGNSAEKAEWRVRGRWPREQLLVVTAPCGRHQLVGHKFFRHQLVGH